MGNQDRGRREQEQTEAAAARFAARAEERRAKVASLKQPGGIARADTSERVAKRIDRLARYYAREPLPATPEETPTAEPEEALRDAVVRQMPTLVDAATPEVSLAEPAVFLEKVILTTDFVDIRYLEGGVAAARAVCRVLIRDPSGRLAGYGSGSLISPRLVLTNHHVLESAETAAPSAIEFNYQAGLDGQPLPSRVFELDPATFFVASEERDFALCAVKATAAELAEFGFNPLIGAEGKAIVGEFVTIVQHPAGRMKQVSLRENRIVDLPEDFLHYEADTEPGSSGSPVFNDQWEVVGLHHASIRAPEREEFGGFLNEGIRVSRILRFLHELDLPPAQRALLEGLPTERIVLRDANGAPPAGGAASGLPPGEPSAEAPGAPSAPALTVPLELSLRIAAPSPALRPAPGAEAIVIDPNYAARAGYDPGFLGGGASRVPLPALSSGLLAKAATREDGAAPKHVLTYHHFSVVMNAERRLAFFTAVNIDGRVSRRMKRESDRWFFDPRIPADQQTSEPVYADNPLDRGHLVRRLDPSWGESEAIAKLAADDTYHFTNCTPQHAEFNQRQTSWAGLEDYILENAETADVKVSVFSGPVFADDDEEYRGVKLPRQFWKVVVMRKVSGDLSATAYLLSQEEMIRGLEVALEEFSYGEYRTFQVPVERVAELTELDFGDLSSFDPLAGREATTAAREIPTPESIVL
jgi:endonuclease G, mitochondrial